MFKRLFLAALFSWLVCQPLQAAFDPAALLQLPAQSLNAAATVDLCNGGVPPVRDTASIRILGSTAISNFGTSCGIGTIKYIVFNNAVSLTGGCTSTPGALTIYGGNFTAAAGQFIRVFKGPTCWNVDPEVPNSVLNDIHFGSNIPYIDIMAFGCQVSVPAQFMAGNYATDNTTCAQNAINAGESAYAFANIFVPIVAGHFCVRGGLTLGKFDRIFGEMGLTGDNFASDLASCDVDVAVITAPQGAVLDHLFLEGFQSNGNLASSYTAAATTLPLTSTLNCTFGCAMSNVTIRGGFYGLLAGTGFADVPQYDVNAGYTYGPAVIYMNLGARLIEDKIDQNFPCSPAAALTYPQPAPVSWSNNLTVAKYQLVQVTWPTGNFYLMACNAGTTSMAGSQPSPITYGVSTPADGTVVWQLFGNNNYSAIQCDTGCQEVYADSVDTIGPYISAYHFTNNLLPSAPPQLIRVIGGTFGGITYPVKIDAGAQMRFIGNEGNACFTTGCAEVLLNTGLTSDFVFADNNFLGPLGNGFIIAGGTQIRIHDNSIMTSAAGAVSGVEFQSGSGSVDFHDNHLTGWTQAIKFDTGSEDNIAVHHNDCSSGNSACLNYSGSATGTHNRIQDNIGYNPQAATSANYSQGSTNTYPINPAPTSHYLTGGTVTHVKIPNNSGADVCTSTPCAVHLGPNETFSVTYSGVPNDVVVIH